MYQSGSGKAGARQREGKGDKSGGKKKKRAEEEEDQRNEKADTRGQQEDKRAHILADYFSRYGTITVTATASKGLNRRRDRDVNHVVKKKHGSVRKSPPFLV